MTTEKMGKSKCKHCGGIMPCKCDKKSESHKKNCDK